MRLKDKKLLTTESAENTEALKGKEFFLFFMPRFAASVCSVVEKI